MDDHRFDTLARGLAAPTSRRAALRGLAAGGVLGALGLTRVAVAEPATGAICTLAFSGSVRLGPSAGQILAPGSSQPGALTGRISIAPSGSGAIEGGILTLADGKQLPVVGHATGRSLSLRIGAGDSRPLVAVGVGERLLTDCAGAFDGLLTGPQAGDLGDWHATAVRQGGSAETSAGGATAGGAASAGGAARTGGAAPTVAPPANSAPQPTQEPAGATQTPAACAKDCGVTFVLDPATCECVCPGVSVKCGEVCCPRGSTCDAATSACACPAGTEICQETCTPSCPTGQAMDPQQCICTDAAPGGGDDGGSDQRCTTGISCPAGGTCCEPYPGYATTNVSCQGNACVCQYSCASAGCPNSDAGAFFTVGCGEDPKARCANFGCG